MDNYEIPLSELIDQPALISPKEEAKSSYLGYAALARLSPEATALGEADIEKSDDNQALRLGVAFQNATRVLMEVRGLVVVRNDIELNPGMVLSTEALGLKQEALKKDIPKVARRYLTKLVGPIDDIALGVEIVPTIVHWLIQLRGEAGHEERRTLDMTQLLTMRFADLEMTQIAAELQTTAGRVKGAFFRFSELIGRKGTVEGRNEAFRIHLESLGKLEPRTILTKQDMDALLPPRIPKNESKGRNGSRPGRTKKARVVSTEVEDNKPYMSPVRSEFVPHPEPDDLLPGETMTERRIRLNNGSK